MAEYIDREAALKAIAEDKIEMTPELIALSRAIGTYTAEQAFDGINQACDRHIESIKILPAADVQPVKWIPVAERLPNIHETVLIYGKSRYRFQKVFCKFVDVGCLEEPEADRDIEKWSTYNDWYEGQEDFTITHWMPLPEPPKDGDNNG